jgi:hypothetical protein
VEPLLIVFGIGLLVAFGYFYWKKEQERREKFRAWARTNQWTFRHERSKSLAREFMFLDRLCQGHSRYAFNILEGEWEGRKSKAFTYHYAVTSHNGKSTTTTHHHFGVVLIQIERDFPELQIHPESIFHKIGQFLGRSDVDLESVEFSKKFEVRCQDKKLAYDFCNTGMMEYLLEHPTTAIEMDGDVLAVFDSGRLEPHELEPYLNHLTQIRGHMPGYLFQD